MLDAGADAEPPLFPARLTRVGERRVAQGRDFDSRGQLIIKGQDRLIKLDQTQAEARLARELQDKGALVIGFGGPGDVSLAVDGDPALRFQGR